MKTPQERFLDKVESFHKAFDALVLAHLAEVQEEDKRVPSCKRGCCACCSTIVTATGINEARYVALRLASSKVEGANWLLRIQQWVGALERAGYFANPAFTLADYLGAKVPCPFLNRDGACGVYEVRPIICRSVHVFDNPPHCGDPEGSAEVLNMDDDVALFHQMIEKAAADVDYEWRTEQVAGPELFPLRVLEAWPK